MTSSGTGHVPFTVFSDSSSSENAQNGGRKNKMPLHEVGGKGIKRVALGEISNNSRHQPLRAAKYVPGIPLVGFGQENVGQENTRVAKPNPVAQPKPFQTSQPGPSFHIYQDPITTATSAPSVSNGRRTIQATRTISAPAPGLSLPPAPDPTDRHWQSIPVRVHHPVVSVQPKGGGPAPTGLASDEAIVIDEDDPTDSQGDSPADSEADSPMLLDLSVNAEQSKKANLNEQRRKWNENKLFNVPDYKKDIYKHLKDIQVRHHPSPYMSKQNDINCNMRNILVDWLVEVAEEYKLHRETLFLSVNYIDRFLSKMSVNRKKLQLVGAASMFLAAKYEEIYPPDVNEFVYITDNTYTREEVIKMEHLILKILSFDMATPTCNLFCELFLKDAGYTEEKDQVFSLTMMLAELTMLDSNTYLQYKPSIVAASCLLLANHACGKEVWSQALQNELQVSIKDLALCVHSLFITYTGCQSHPQQAVMDKYKQNRYKEVALLTPPISLPEGILPLPEAIPQSSVTQS